MSAGNNNKIAAQANAAATLTTIVPACPHCLMYLSWK